MQKASWDRMMRAMFFYDCQNFTYRDVNWTVEPEITAITRPKDCRDFMIDDKALVGSAEQSFLEIYDQLDEHEIYYALTPCFRDEKEETELIKKYFMKIELFSKDKNNFSKIFNSAFNFFFQEVEDTGLLTIIDTGVRSRDIFYNNVEIGSYYWSDNGEKEWVCGTGLAEPRFTLIQD